MRTFFDDLRKSPVVFRPVILSMRVGLIAALATLGAMSLAQAPPAPRPTPDPTTPAAQPTPAAPQESPAAPAPQATNPSEPAPNASATPTQANPPADTAAKPSATPSRGLQLQTVGGEIKEDQLKQLLVGKTLYLRGGYQENNLEFDERGRLLGHSPQGSYTLSQIQINKVKLSKHKLELQGDRYALHFLGAAPFEDPTAATDRVKITPKKKRVKISFDREQVEKEKKEKNKDKDKDGKKKNKHDAKEAKVEKSNLSVSSDTPQETTNADVQESTIAQSSGRDPLSDKSDKHKSDKKLTTTTSEAHASQLLLTAMDKVFSRGIDERMIDSMPDFWKLYYQAAAAKVDYKPTDPGVYRQSNVDQKAKLISAIDPPSNEFAQANGVAGIALYHAVIGSDGKAEEIVAGRPIGFGLDESAEQTIRKATFQPAMKDGKPVPVALDVVVSFRIYSKRTSQPSAQAATDKPNEPVLPGPYTVQAQAQAAPQQSPNAQ